MADVEAILEKLRSSLKRRGAEGIRGLGRHFKIIDRSGDGHIDAEEFAQLLAFGRASGVFVERIDVALPFGADLPSAEPYACYRYLRGAFCARKDQPKWYLN